MKRFISLLTIFTMLPFVAHAEIASKAYVDEQDNKLIFGTTTPDAEAVQSVEENGGVAGQLHEIETAIFGDGNDDPGLVGHISDSFKDAVSATQSTDGIMMSSNGDVKIASGPVVDDSLIAAGITMAKIELPTPPSACETAGCMLMYLNGNYTWEVVTRNTGETPTVNSNYAVSADLQYSEFSTYTPADTVAPQCQTHQDCDSGRRCIDGRCIVEML